MHKTMPQFFSEKKGTNDLSIGVRDTALANGNLRTITRNSFHITTSSFKLPPMLPRNEGQGCCEYVLCWEETLLFRCWGVYWLFYVVTFEFEAIFSDQRQFPEVLNYFVWQYMIMNLWCCYFTAMISRWQAYSTIAVTDVKSTVHHFIWAAGCGLEL